MFMPVIAARLTKRRSTATATSWWLSGGISAANCIAAYQPKGAASLAASYTNLAKPGTYDAAPGTAPSWAAGTGWTFNGSSQYLTTGVTPSQAYSVAVQIAGATVSSLHYIIGGNVTDPRYWGLALFNSPSLTYYVHFAATGVGPALTAGNLIMTPTHGYRNGNSESTFTTATNTSGALDIGRRSDGILYYAGQVQAVAIYNTAIDSAASALATAMAAL